MISYDLALLLLGELATTFRFHRSMQSPALALACSTMFNMHLVSLALSFGSINFGCPSFEGFGCEVDEVDVCFYRSLLMMTFPHLVQFIIVSHAVEICRSLETFMLIPSPAHFKNPNPMVPNVSKISRFISRISGFISYWGPTEPWFLGGVSIFRGMGPWPFWRRLFWSHDTGQQGETASDFSM